MRALFRDWARAPISGTLIGMCAVGSGIALWRGQLDIALLWLVIGNQTSDRRQRYLENVE